MKKVFAVLVLEELIKDLLNPQNFLKDSWDLIKNLSKDTQTSTKPSGQSTMLTHLLLWPLHGASTSCRTIVGGANVELGIGTDGATLAMEVS